MRPKSKYNAAIHVIRQIKGPLFIRVNDIDASAICVANKVMCMHDAQAFIDVCRHLSSYIFLNNPLCEC